MGIKPAVLQLWWPLFGHAGYVSSCCMLQLVLGRVTASQRTLCMQVWPRQWQGSSRSCSNAGCSMQLQADYTARGADRCLAVALTLHRPSDATLLLCRYRVLSLSAPPWLRQQTLTRSIGAN
jgi:hypothetical protein